MALQQPTSPSLRWALQIIQLATVCVQICVWHSVRSHACIHARADDSPASQSSYPNRSASPCDWPYCWVTHICWAATALHGQQMHTPYPGASLSRSPFDIMLRCMCFHQRKCPIEIDCPLRVDDKNQLQTYMDLFQTVCSNAISNTFAFGLVYATIIHGSEQLDAECIGYQISKYCNWKCLARMRLAERDMTII